MTITIDRNDYRDGGRTLTGALQVAENRMRTHLVKHAGLVDYLHYVKDGICLLPSGRQYRQTRLIKANKKRFNGDSIIWAGTDMDGNEAAVKAYDGLIMGTTAFYRHTNIEPVIAKKLKRTSVAGNVLGLIDHGYDPKEKTVVNEWEYAGMAESAQKRTDDGSLTLGEAILAVERVSAVLSELSRYGGIHGDVAPAQIMISGDKTYLIDFDVGFFPSMEMMNDPMIMRLKREFGGRFAFTPPEIFTFMADVADKSESFEEISPLLKPSRDVYAAGLTIVNMIKGKPPFYRYSGLEDNDFVAALFTDHLGNKRPYDVDEVSDSVPKEISNDLTMLYLGTTNPVQTRWSPQRLNKELGFLKRKIENLGLEDYRRGTESKSIGLLEVASEAVEEGLKANGSLIKGGTVCMPADLFKELAA